jgi:dihydroxy-acid dehydratase
MKNIDYKKNPRPFSSIVINGYERAPSRAMLRAVGFTDEDFSKPQVGVVSTWSMVTPCNMHIDQLARKAALGIDQSGGKAVIFGTITVSDGISMGTEGMKYSLVSREVIADSVETVAGCEGFDGLVAIGGCDMYMPGCVIAMARRERLIFSTGAIAADSIATSCACARMLRWRTSCSRRCGRT